MSGETLFWRNDLRMALKKRGHVSRVESHQTSIGFPDVDFCINGAEGKMELKFCCTPKKGYTLRPAQFRWLTDRHNAGGNAWILGKFEPDDGPVQFHLLTGHNACEVHQQQYRHISEWSEMSAAVWVGKIDIDELVEIITRGRRKSNP